MSDRYWVHIITDQASEFHGPFDFDQAKSFARIGSGHGRFSRLVTRGKFGTIVRMYDAGKRVYPSSPQETLGLFGGEIPRQLVA